MIANTLSVLFGYQSTATTESVATSSSHFDPKTGQWRINLHEEVARTKMTTYLINWMYKRHFQAIVTDPRTICFLQSDSNRQCFCQFQQTPNEGKCMNLTMWENGKHVPDSPTDIFGQSVFTELSLDLATENFLAPQIFNGWPPFNQTQGEIISRENIFLDLHHFTTSIFIRMHQHGPALLLLTKELRKQKFEAPDLKSSIESNEIIFNHRGSKLSLQLDVGFNQALQTIIQFSFHREEEPTTAEKKSDRQHLTSMTKIIAIAMAQQNLLRSQKLNMQKPSCSTMPDLSPKEHLELADVKITEPLELEDGFFFE